MVFLGLGVALMLVNGWASWRIRQAGDTLHKPHLHIAMVWLAPGIGALMAWAELRAMARAAAPLTLPPPGDVAPTEVTAGSATFPLDQHLVSAGGWPLVDWQAASAWTGALDATLAAQARDTLHRGWLLHLRDALGEHVFLHETADAYVLSSLEPRVAAATASYIASTRQRVARVLQGLARYPEGQKSILLVLDDEANYYHYVSQYYPDGGEFAFSGGMFIDAGCPHFVTVAADLSLIEPVIAHELTHAALAHLNLPLWLDEGLAVNTERQLAVALPSVHTPRELQAKHAAFWGHAEIQAFWRGESFQRTDDGNLLSYDLARILVEQLAKPSWPAFARFVTHAKRTDAGNASAKEHLGIDLGPSASALVCNTPSDLWAPGVGGVWTSAA